MRGDAGAGVVHIESLSKALGFLLTPPPSSLSQDVVPDLAPPGLPPPTVGRSALRKSPVALTFQGGTIWIRAAAGLETGRAKPPAVVAMLIWTLSLFPGIALPR